LGIENRKPKIVNFFSLSKPAKTTKKKFIKKEIIKNYLVIYFFASARTTKGRGGWERGGEGVASARTHHVRASALTRFLPHLRVNADAGGRPRTSRRKGHLNGHFYPKTSVMTSLGRSTHK
jgi:hypothetical protein